MAHPTSDFSIPHHAEDAVPFSREDALFAAVRERVGITIRRQRETTYSKTNTSAQLV
jgi:hypothetical protein